MSETTVERDRKMFDSLAEISGEDKYIAYVAGPMRGYEDFNFPAFDAAQAQLERKGWRVISPAEMDRKNGFDPSGMKGTHEELDEIGFDFQEAFDRDYEAIKRCDAVVLLPGWEQSSGARAEKALAELFRKDVIEFATMKAPTNGKAWADFPGVGSKGMGVRQMSHMMDRVFSECQSLRSAGQKEYAHRDENAFANFERVAERLGISREAVLMVYLEKHLDGIHSYIQGHKSQRESVKGRINDAIVYLCLLRGMVESSEA